MAYDSSFAGAGFDCETSKTSRDLVAEVTVRHIPGGSTVFIDLAGDRPKAITLGCFFLSPTDYFALEAVVGSQGTLSYFDGTYTAVLLSLKRTMRNVGTTNETTADGSFLLL